MGIEYDHLFQDVAYEYPLDFVKANEIYSLSSITIGINDQFNPYLQNSNVIYTKLRDFESVDYFEKPSGLLELPRDKTHNTKIRFNTL